MKIQEKNLNVSINTVSTDLSIIEDTYDSNVSTNNQDKSLSFADCRNKNEDKHDSNVFRNNQTKDLSLADCRSKNKSKGPLWKCRYVIVLILYFSSFYTTYIRMNISINIVAMVNHSTISYSEKSKSDSCANLIKNITEDVPIPKMDGELDWSPKIQGYILGSYFFGQITTQLPASLLAQRYGAKWILFGSALLAGVCMLLIPLFSYVSTSAIIVLQVIRGLAQGCYKPSNPTLAANWFPKTERGFLISFIKSGSCLGCCLGCIISGFVCELAGWSISFYVTGAIGILLTILVFTSMYENPKEHPRISKEELNFILKNQENVLQRRRPKLPWRKVLTSVPVYALAYGLFGQCWALTQFWTVHSTFLATILHYPIGELALELQLAYLECIYLVAIES